MADHIEVVYIKEDKQEEAPESKDEQTPEFNEVAEKALQEEELNVIKEQNHKKKYKKKRNRNPKQRVLIQL